MKCASRLLIMVMLLSSIASYSEGTPRKTVSYFTEIKPSLEATACVNSKQIQDMTFFTYAFEGCGKADSNPLLAKLSTQASEVFVAYPLLTSQLFGKVQSNIAEGPDRQSQLQAQFRSALLSDKMIQSALMPRVHAFLAAEGLSCPDCPGPEVVAPARSISKQDIMPYLTAFLWPSRIMPNGGISFMVCVGSNGLSHINNADATLSEAAFSCLNMKQEVMAMATSAIRMATADEGYKSLTENEAKLGYLRSYLAKVLPADPAFSAFLEKQLSERLPVYGLICTDCAAPTSVSPQPK